MNYYSGWQQLLTLYIFDVTSWPKKKYLMSPKQKETIVWVVLMGRMGTAPFCSMIPIIVIFYYHVLPFWVLPSSSTNKEKEFQHVQFLLQPDNVSRTLLEKYYYILLRIDIWLASILGQGSLCMNKAIFFLKFVHEQSYWNRRKEQNIKI